MNIHPALILLSILAAVLLSAVVGVWLETTPRRAMRIVPLSGGVLAGIALFWVHPELSESLGWGVGSCWLAGGFLVMWLVNRYVYPVCPSCSHDHDHTACITRLHGFAAPLILAAGVHAFFDGVGLGAAGGHASSELGRAVLWGIALHKVPEGLALGAILRASLKTWQGALGGVALTQAPMLIGMGLEFLLAAHIDERWIVGLLGVAGGSFLFLGFHAVHGEWKRVSSPATLALAGAGAAVAAIIKYSFSSLPH